MPSNSPPFHSSLFVRWMGLSALGALVLTGAPARATLPSTYTLSGTIRDFTPSTNPDFQYRTGTDPDIVETTLGSDEKPVYNTATSNPTVNSAASFDQWYNDVTGVNLSTTHDITLALDTATGVYAVSYTHLTLPTNREV